MNNEHTHLDADSHNFGKKTLLRDNKIVKFRNILSEFLVFGESSPLRLLVNKLYQEHFLSYELLPSLAFYSSLTNGPSLKASEMEELRLGPISSPLKDNDYFKIGAYIAFCHYFGLTDNHRSNVLIGMKNESFTFVSVDCETILTKIPHAISLGFFCHETDCPCNSKYCLNYGLSSVKELGEFIDSSMPAKVIYGYLQMITIFHEYVVQIKKNSSRLFI